MRDRELRTKLKKVVAKNAKEVIPVLDQIFAKDDGILDEILLLESKLERAETQYRKGIITIQERNMTSDQINDSFFQIIEKIKLEDAESYLKTQMKFDKILVVCLEQERKKEIRKLFPTTYWPGLIIEVSSALLEENFVNDFKIVVFDNNIKPAPSYVDELIKSYLDTRDPYLLYFGSEPKRWLGEPPYVEKAYFANSVFSIQTRLYEMIEYIDNITSSEIEQELQDQVQ